MGTGSFTLSRPTSRLLEIDNMDRVHFEDGRVARFFGLTNIDVDAVQSDLAGRDLSCRIAGETGHTLWTELQVVECHARGEAICAELAGGGPRFTLTGTADAACP